MKQLWLGSLRNLEDCLVSCKRNPHVWEKMPIEGAIHLRSHNIPLTIKITQLPEKCDFSEYSEFDPVSFSLIQRYSQLKEEAKAKWRSNC